MRRRRGNFLVWVALNASNPGFPIELQQNLETMVGVPTIPWLQATRKIGVSFPQGLNEAASTGASVNVLFILHPSSVLFDCRKS
jgi:hypothetical protein